MIPDLSGFVPFLLAIGLVALVAAAVSVTVIGQDVVRHHRARVSRHESIPTYYRRLVHAH